MGTQCPSNLDIIVEDGVRHGPVAEMFEVLERVVGREVLELDEELGERLVHLVHELFHEIGHLFWGHPVLPEAEVERVI